MAKKDEIKVSKTAINSFRKFLASIYESQGFLPVSKKVCIIKCKNEKIDISFYGDPQYVNFSGVANNGTVLTQKTFQHRIDPTAHEQWKKVVFNPNKASEMLRILAEESGTEAVFVNNKIMAAHSDRIIYVAE